MKKTKSFLLVGLAGLLAMGGAVTVASLPFIGPKYQAAYALDAISYIERSWDEENKVL